MTSKFPLFYFKPTICSIDDDQLFLDAINISLKKRYNSLIFNDPLQALEYLKSYRAPLKEFDLDNARITSDAIHEDDPLDIYISKIRRLISTPNKFKEIAVLVIDYNMPGMKGLELCKAIKCLKIKKVLLTGEATFEEATEAFNLGLIDKFIKKDYDFAETLHKCIDELSREYFHDRAKLLTSQLAITKSSLVSEKEYINFFSSWCQVNQIEEYFLMDKFGSFVTKDKKGMYKYFVAMNEFAKKSFISLNDDANEKIGHLLKQLENQEALPFFGINKESWQIDLNEWKNHFYTANPRVANETWSWTVINEKNF